MKIVKLTTEKQFEPIEFKLTIESEKELEFFYTLGGYEVTSANLLKQSEFYSQFTVDEIISILRKLYNIKK